MNRDYPHDIVPLDAIPEDQHHKYFELTTPEVGQLAAMTPEERGVWLAERLSPKSPTEKMREGLLEKFLPDDPESLTDMQREMERRVHAPLRNELKRGVPVSDKQRRGQTHRKT